MSSAHALTCGYLQSGGILDILSLFGLECAHAAAVIEAGGIKSSEFFERRKTLDSTNFSGSETSGNSLRQ